MKVRAYLRVGKQRSGKPKVMASSRPSSTPVYDARNTILPTIAFAIDLNIPDELFLQAEHVIAELDVTGDRSDPADELKVSADRGDVRLERLPLLG